MQEFSVSPREAASSLWRHRHLTLTLIRSDVAGRYRGSMLGLAWSFFHPVFMLLVYTFVFSVVFKARWSGGSGSNAEFAIVLFAGLLVFGLFSECINKAPGLILGNASYVKKVLFPLEILPWIAFGSALFHMLIGLLVWLLFYGLLLGVPPLTALLLPVVLLPVVLLTLGCSWFLASLGVFVRDVSQVVSVLTATLMFMSPIFYPVSALPEAYQPLLLMNPLTPAVEQVRDVLVWGRNPDWSLFGVSLASSALVCWLGFAWFQRTRRGFADVM